MNKDRRLMDMACIIRNRRIELGYTSGEKFANKHKLNRSVYQRWENGEDLNLTSLIKLLDILKMSGKTLFEKWENSRADMPRDFDINELRMVAEEKEPYEKAKVKTTKIPKKKKNDKAIK